MQADEVHVQRRDLAYPPCILILTLADACLWSLKRLVISYHESTLMAYDRQPCCLNHIRRGKQHCVWLALGWVNTRQHQLAMLSFGIV
jgi:hypothetical protein